eukprot:12938189-Prorocentrum_lima.AAC.1
MPATETFTGSVPSGLGTRALLSPRPETAEENFFEDLLALDTATRELPTWFLDRYPPHPHAQPHLLGPHC